jgi:hypothetical protein
MAIPLAMIRKNHCSFLKTKETPYLNCASVQVTRVAYLGILVFWDVRRGSCRNGL